MEGAVFLLGVHKLTNCRVACQWDVLLLDFQAQQVRKILQTKNPLGCFGWDRLKFANCLEFKRTCFYPKLLPAPVWVLSVAAMSFGEFFRILVIVRLADVLFWYILLTSCRATRWFNLLFKQALAASIQVRSGQGWWQVAGGTPAKRIRPFVLW